jgi:protein-L-isoaspartate O-methyltransferase
MRCVVLYLAVGAGLGLGSAFAAPVGNGVLSTNAEQGIVEQAQYESRYCRRLRRACENKDVRGEVGEGNCRRYRRECGRRR